MNLCCYRQRVVRSQGLKAIMFNEDAKGVTIVGVTERSLVVVRGQPQCEAGLMKDATIIKKSTG